MTVTKFRPILLATAIALSGCGGGGGGGVASIPPPPVAPTPTPPSPPPSPPPTPTPPPTFAPAIIFPTVTTSTQFATVGYQGKFDRTTSASLTGSGFSVSYDAAANNYVIDVPASQPGVFEYSNKEGSLFSGKLTDPANPGQFQSISLGVSRSQFDYTAWAYYQKEDSTAGWMAFGTPTAQAEVPVTGTASYTAEAHGYGGAYIDGQAKLQFNFGAGALSGTLDLWDAEWDPGERSYGHFTMANTALGSGQNLGQFSGDLADGANSRRGSLNGQLTGPNARELMARWTASYPNSENVMYGILVGKKD